MENAVATTNKIRATREIEYATTLLHHDRIDGAVELCVLLLAPLENVATMFRKGAEQGIVDGLKAWCARAGCDETTALSRLRARVGRPVNGL
jgi:hypothetical protein